jgi:hypothetical protein
MTDTPAEINRQIRALFSRKTGAERIQMASDMFESARCMALASLLEDFPPEKTREFLLQRTYPEWCPVPKQLFQAP